MARTLALDLAELAAYRITNTVEVEGWATRRSGSGPFHPVGFVVHHTAGTDSLQLCIDRALVNYYIPKSGVIHLLSNGRTAHPGPGSSVVLAEVKADEAPPGDASKYSPRWRGEILANDTDGYPWLIGVEVENLGNGVDPYTNEQIDSMLRLCAAHCLAFGWSENRVIHHREWTDRKIDMSWYGDLRFGVALQMLSMKEVSTVTDMTGKALAEFNRAVELGITDGSDPNGFAERDEAAVMTVRGIDKAVARAVEQARVHDATVLAEVNKLRSEFTTVVTALTRKVDDGLADVRARLAAIPPPPAPAPGPLPPPPPPPAPTGTVLRIEVDASDADRVLDGTTAMTTATVTRA